MNLRIIYECDIFNSDSFYNNNLFLRILNISTSYKLLGKKNALVF